MPVIPVFGRVSQEDLKFEAILGVHDKNLTKQKTKQKQKEKYERKNERN
jgi:hypothetical protein